MIRFFSIGRAKPRPTIQSFHRADRPAPAAFLPKPPTAPADPAITQETPFAMNFTAPSPAVPARVFAPIRLGDASPVHSSVIERHALAF